MQSTLPAHLPHEGLASVSKQNNTESSQSYAQTLEESVSDWRKGSAATSITATSIHDTPHESLPTVKSPDEMTASNASPLGNSLVSELPVEIPEQPAKGNKPKNWDWLKKAGAAIGVGQGKSATLEIKEQSRTGKEVTPVNAKATSVESDASDDEAASPPEGSPKGTASRFANISRAPWDHHETRQHNKPKAESKPSRRQSLITAAKDASRQPSPTRSKQGQKPRRDRAPPSQPVSPSLSGESATSDWGPGGLVLEEDGSTWQTDTVASSKVDGSWWTKSAPSIDSTTSKGKIPLKPLRLARSGSIASSANDGLSEAGRSNGGHSRGKKSPTSNHRTRPSPLSSPRQAKQKANPRNLGPPSARSPIQVQPPRSRPMPDDMPESPASSRRFTKAADQMDAFTLQEAPKRMPKGKSDELIPLVPIAPPIAPVASERKAQNRRSGLVSKPGVPANASRTMEEEWPITPVAETPVAAARSKRTPQRAPRRQPTGNDAWTNATMPQKHRKLHSVVTREGS